jgi:hypothetical protein
MVNAKKPSCSYKKTKKNAPKHGRQMVDVD